ncbi:hypothetical protein LSM04_002752 [Trypanosoma melophagium]|uniref:uncharacterized protein n=1 Tax=Trypanosoma melophagium TaxID=715481 RepID=UPI00351A5438|nr:hypothetical protein LSM04_002752 [Trypanosoma melophagium]
MREDVSPPPVIHMDDELIHHDAYRLILNTTHTTAELLELLGSPSPHSAPQTPPQGTAKHNPLRMLERLGEPPAPRPRGDVLHEEGMRRIQDIAKWQEEQKKAMIEEETKECTFKPVISNSAKEVAPKGLSTFMEKCIEWKKAAGVRLQKKAAQDRINRGEDEEMTRWKMSDRSRQVLERLKKKGVRRNKLWEPKTPHTANSLTCNKADVSNQEILFGSTVENNKKDVLASQSFHPVIHSAVGDALMSL